MTKRILNEFRLGKIAAVDKPCQEHAISTIMKVKVDSVADKIAKFCYDDEMKGALKFSEVLSHNEMREKYWKMREVVYPLMDALTSTISSIVLDQSLSNEGKGSMIKESIDEFMDELKTKMPEAEAEMNKFIDDLADGSITPFYDSIIKQREDAKMADKDLEGQVADLTTKLEKATKDLAEASLLAKMTDGEKVFAKNMTVEEAVAFMALDADARMAKMKPADDEVVTIDGTEVRKSAVGAAAFAVMKSQQKRLDDQQADIMKARNEAELATLTKRAGDEFSHVVGTDAEKAGILKSMAQMPEEVRKSLETILKSAESMAKKGFQVSGHSILAPEAGSASEELDTLTKAHVKEHNVDYATAYNEVITKRADLYDRVLKEGN